MSDSAFASEPEEILRGGNTAASVVRRGTTVRKPVTPSTPAVQGFVRHLRAVGFQAAPEPLGVDDEGRQVWEYVSGPLWHDGKTHSSSDLRRVGAIIRELHEAAASFEMPESARWNMRYARNDHELVCHNDLAPWNLVCGEDRWVFIDWDGTAPATRLWDLAWSSLSFPPFEPEGDLAAAAGGLRALLDGYGLDGSRYGELIGLMVTRARAEHDLIAEGAREGQQPWARLYDEGHHRYWGPVADYVSGHASALEDLLKSGEGIGP
ncbi:aminoglycoside phosphotransferase family protein [Acidobacteria bacterium AB60]|nr:aminoglycoside phosphotransferase family protein [Acidobacteria bacterium AB60]